MKFLPLLGGFYRSSGAHPGGWEYITAWQETGYTDLS